MGGGTEGPRKHESTKMGRSYIRFRAGKKRRRGTGNIPSNSKDVRGGSDVRLTLGVLWSPIIREVRVHREDPPTRIVVQAHTIANVE